VTHQWIGRLLLISFLAPAPAVFAQASAGRGHNEGTRESWQKVEEIFAAMAVRPGAVVADVGAGGGFFTSRLAKAVGPGGQVLAVDIGASVLDRLRTRVAEENLANVKVIEGAVDDPRLPAHSVDAILIVNAYHEMTEYPAMLARMKEALKPGGRLVIVEPVAESRRDQPRATQTRNHEISAEYVKKELQAAGFSQVSFQDPFTARPNGHGQEWMLVSTPATAAATSATLWSTSKARDWQDAGLRIGMDEYLRRRDAGEDILLLDVRDDASFKDGHMPGAVLMTVEQITSREGLAMLSRETRPMVAYCSCESEQSSARVAIILRDAGIQRAHALVGGYEAWRQRAGVR
jgi:ubiquinone/menaquinone biosynthesis C-methylase UbiE/rhodanese-related sulfurtransferase